ncbi:MAG: hypothetical protein IJ202_02625 [Bacteroidales bacterium]|nr:hypothetical protein [Bacteroidales bacterium]MBQ9712465.1 hypothetical protein [Bacteroidales bacterium]
MKRLSVGALLCALSLILLAGCGKDKDFSGEWAETTAERIVAVFTPEGDGYSVTIGWREDGLAQYEYWSMKATPKGRNTLVYENGTDIIRSFENIGDPTYTDDTIYTDGTGEFVLEKDGALTWTDNKDPEGGKTVFMRSSFGVKFPEL